MQGTYDPHVQEDTSKVVEGRLEEILAPDAEVVKYLLFRDGAVPADLLARVQEIVGSGRL